MTNHRFAYEYHKLREAAKESEVSVPGYVGIYLFGLFVVGMFFVTMWVLKLGNALL